MSETQDFIFFNLPQDIIFDILSRLPTKSLIHFRCVCKSSPPLISHPSFIKLHLSPPPPSSTAPDKNHLLVYYESTDYIYHFYSFRSPTSFRQNINLNLPYKTLHGYLRIAGSDKGILCFFDTNYYSNIGYVILWNPSIQKFKKIGKPSYDFHDKFSHFVVGFGFVLREFEYKVVMISYHLDNSKINNDVLVYSLSTNSWKKLDDVIAPCYLIRGWSSNVVVNGFVNWLAYKDVVGGLYSAIMAFDLDNESFYVLELPKDIVPNCDQVDLVSYGEECSSLLLLLCAHYFEVNGEKWDMWVMGEYGVADSWKKVCVVSQPMLSIPPLLMRNDHEVLIVMNDGRLVLFDAKKNEIQDLEMLGLPRTFSAISYTASLALLQG